MIAWRIARKARRWVKYRTALKVAKAARRQGIGAALAFALVEQESNFRHIFGHDNDFMAGLYVTEARYRALQRRIRGGGTSNGVGFTQITYPPYILQHNGLWDQDNNLNFGFKLIADTVHAYGGDVRKALAVYNGGAGNPQYDYADEVLARKRKWAARFS